MSSASTHSPSPIEVIFDRVVEMAARVISLAFPVSVESEFQRNGIKQHLLDEFRNRHEQNGLLDEVFDFIRWSIACFELLILPPLEEEWRHFTDIFFC